MVDRIEAPSPTREQRDPRPFSIVPGHEAADERWPRRPPPVALRVGHRLSAGRLAELRANGRDHVIAAIADQQRGVVSYAQLIAAGVSPSAIDTRVRRYQLHRLHRGVYAVGHMALVPLAWELAALLACGPGP